MVLRQHFPQNCQEKKLHRFWVPSKTRPGFEPLRNKPYLLDFHPSELIYPLDEQHQLPVPWQTAAWPLGWLLWVAFFGGPQGVGRTLGSRDMWNHFLVVSDPGFCDSRTAKWIHPEEETESWELKMLSILPEIVVFPVVLPLWMPLFAPPRATGAIWSLRSLPFFGVGLICEVNPIVKLW